MTFMFGTTGTPETLSRYSRPTWGGAHLLSLTPLASQKGRSSILLLSTPFFPPRPPMLTAGCLITRRGACSPRTLFRIYEVDSL